ncbi:MAG TPA: undecaprenyl-diphosphate phosphatase [Candidatus Saccharimonadales bacterium]|nr:undecaprenyl-diphosphate phosphatase [Candidatus Saccharimonadales bacterium]
MLSAGLILFLAALQGVTELFPVSSLGHAVVVPPLIGLSFRQSSPAFVPVLAMLHLGTAAALLFLYRRDWVRIIAGFFRAAARGRISDPDERLAVMLIIGTIPAGLIGFLLQDPLKTLFGDPRVASVFLIVNGCILFAAEMFRRRDERRRAPGGAQILAHEEDDPEYQRVEGLSLRTTMFVGIFQAGALLPGISRSGITMAAGLVAGLRHEEAARFSFLLATPIILAAGLLELPTLGSDAPTLLVSIAAAAMSGLLAYASARFLLRYLRLGRLDPFAYYCAALGAAGLVFIH